MKKFLLGLLAIVIILLSGTAVWFTMTFRTQYEAAESIRMVEDGMYEYYYEGDAGLDLLLSRGGAKNSAGIAVFATEYLSHGFAHLNLKSSEFGCSTVNAVKTNGTLLTARNFDWPQDDGDMVIIHDRPADGYASVATFNVSFFKFGDDFKPETMTQKFMMLGSIYVALDGMNEKGLFVADLVAGDDEETHQTGRESNVTTSLAIRLLLDRASNVEEALDLLGRYNMHSDINLAHHLSISDSKGRCVVVEWVDNQMYVTDSPVCTNHYLADSPKLKTQEVHANSQERYDTLQSQLNTKTYETLQDITESIASVSNPNTRWSVVYDRENLTATYYQNADFSHPYVASIATSSR